jgi:hypothetical protein
VSSNTTGNNKEHLGSSQAEEGLIPEHWGTFNKQHTTAAIGERKQALQQTVREETGEGLDPNSRVWGTLNKERWQQARTSEHQ